MADKKKDDMRGALFPNTRKRKGKKDPDFTGDITVGGVTYWLSSWKEESKAGKKYLSIKIGEVKQVKGEKPSEAYASRSSAEPPMRDDDIPW